MRKNKKPKTPAEKRKKSIEEFKKQAIKPMPKLMDLTKKSYIELPPCPIKRVEIVVDESLGTLNYVRGKMNWLKAKGFDVWLKRKPAFRETIIIFEGKNEKN